MVFNYYLIKAINCSGEEICCKSYDFKKNPIIIQCECENKKKCTRSFKIIDILEYEVQENDKLLKQADKLSDKAERVYKKADLGNGKFNEKLIDEWKNLLNESNKLTNKGIKIVEKHGNRKTKESHA